MLLFIYSKNDFFFFIQMLIRPLFEMCTLQSHADPFQPLVLGVFKCDFKALAWHLKWQFLHVFDLN